jgi:serine/threonine protein kinase
VGTFGSHMDFMIKPIRTFLGMEGEPAAAGAPDAPAPVPVAGEVQAMTAPEAQAAREETSTTILSSTFRCPERGEEFEVYVRTLERDFKAYDPGLRIEKWLGSGGFCDVFLVPEVNIPGKGVRRAVLRVLRPTIYRTPNPEVNNSNIRLFLTEMGYNLYLSSQSAPHVVKMLDFGFFGRKAGEPRHLYMIMEYVEGEDISHRWRRRPSDEKEIIKRVIQVVQIAGIVGELHFRGIIHCDLKPTNILMRGDEAYITDFGSARWAHVEDVVGDMHMQVPGTQTYMSYEQLLGSYYRLDQRTDVFSLAVLACTAFTGVNPFEARASVDIDSDERGLSALADIEPQIPRIPYRNGDRLRGFLLECLSRKVDERPATMVEFQRRLNQWVLES